MVGKSPKSKADPAANTMLSPAPPEYGDGEDPIARAGAARAEPAGARDRELAARSSQRMIPAASAAGAEVKHIDDEILEYLGRQLPEADLARIDAHLDACNDCRELMHHVVQGMAQSSQADDDDLADSGSTFTPGSVINARYRIRNFVGRGGMGEVYEAFDQLMDRRIALKTVLCTVADRPRAARRLKEEVRNAQRVGHPHVCRINDLQEHQQDGFGPPLPFITMEFVDGERLGHRLLAGPLPLEDVRRIALQLLAGLEAAHQRGVLHLDFKSDNVMLRRNAVTPDAVIMDFGLSRIQGQQSRMRTSERRQFAGTLPYMSVEQLECRDDLGPATDVYAFGIVLYEMLTRALPFEGDSLGAVLLKQLKERAKPPSRHVPGLARALDRFVLKCLHSNPRLRYADAGQALRALKALGPSWSEPKGLQRHWKTALSIGVGAGLAALIATSALRRAPGTLSSAATPIAGLEAAAQPNLERHSQALTPVMPAAPPAAPSPAQLPAEPPAQLSAEPPAAAPAASIAPPALAPAARAGAAAPATQRRRVPSTSETRAAAKPSAAPAAVASAPSSVETTAEPKPEAAATPADNTSWKPEKVPKRLGVPAVSPAAGAP